MSDRPVRRVARFANNQVWALRESTLDTLVDVLRMRAAGITLSKEEIQVRIGAAKTPTANQRGTVAVLPLAGVIAPKMNVMVDISGGVALDLWLREFRTFRDDAGVSAIVIDCDTPGGSVFGVPEAATEIYNARDVKPIIAVVNPECASAGLWIASQASEIVCTPSGEIGSLGVFMCHEDWSKANEMMGLKPTYISAGQYKTEGNADEPLSDEALAYYQMQVDAIYADFVKTVAKGRGVAPAKAKADFGQGRMLMAKDALAIGLIDRIATLDETVARLSGGKRKGSTAAVTSAPAPRAESADGDGERTDSCTACSGSGLRPEAFMGDPNGQLPCEACGGTGKTSAAPPALGGDDGAAARALADRDAIDLALA